MAISEKKREREHKINFAGKSLYSDIGSDPFCHNEKTKLLVLTPNPAIAFIAGAKLTSENSGQLI